MRYEIVGTIDHAEPGLTVASFDSIYDAVKFIGDGPITRGTLFILDTTTGEVLS